MEITTSTAHEAIKSFIRPYVGNLFPGCIVGCANRTQKFVYVSGTQDGIIPISDTNIFDIASVTKALLNVLTLKLIPLEELDQRITDSFSQRGRFRDLLTVRHLLSFGVEFGDKYQTSKMARGELLYLLEHSDLIHPPGISYRYTNIASMILTKFLEQKFGKKFEQLLSDELLSLIGMNNTVFDPLHNGYISLNIIPTERKLERGVVQDESARILDEPIGSAGLFSTIDDLLTFGQSFLGNDTYLSRSTISAMSRSQLQNAAMSFGLGMGLRHQNECDLTTDDGQPITVLKKNGFSGVHFCVLPENDFCFVVFGNICYHRRPEKERDQFSAFHKKLLRMMYENRAQLL